MPARPPGIPMARLPPPPTTSCPGHWWSGAYRSRSLDPQCLQRCWLWCHLAGCMKPGSSSLPLSYSFLYPEASYISNMQMFVEWIYQFWIPISKKNLFPGWCSSVDQAQAWEPKHCWFDYQSGHMPALRASFPVGDTREATTHWCFSPSLPLSLKINKIKINKIKNLIMYQYSLVVTMCQGKLGMWFMGTLN